MSPILTSILSLLRQKTVCTVIAFSVATLSTLLLWDAVFYRVPFALYFAAVSLVAWRAGWVAGLAVAVAGVLTVAAYQRFPTDLLIPSLILLGVSVVISLLAAMRDRALIAMRSSERTYKLMVENVRDYALFMTDAEGRVTKWNVGAERVLGWREEEIVGNPASIIFTPEDREAGADAGEMEKAARDGHAADERWHQRKDGSRFFAVGMMMRVDDEAGRHVGFTKVLGDMTERLRAEETRRMVEFRWQRLVEQSPLSIQVFSPDGSVRQVNRAWERLWGITLADVPGYNILQDPQLDAAGMIPRFERAFAGEPVTIEPVPYTLDRGQYAGRPRWVGAYVYPVKDDAGQVEEVVLVHEDVTERRQAEEALRSSEARYAAGVGAAIDCIISMDHRGVVTGWNPAAERTFGYSSEDAVGRELALLIIPPALREAHRTGLARYLATGDGPVLGRRIEITAVRKDATEFPVELSITRLPSDGPAEFVGYLRDITEAKRAERDLAAARHDLEIRVEQRTRELAEANATLRSEREFLSAVLEHAVDGIVACDADGTLQLFNSASRKFHGLPAQPLPPEQWAEYYDLYHSDGKTRMTKEQVPLFRALAEGVVKDVEMVIAPQHQQPRLLMANGQAIYDADGRKLGAVVVMHDLTAARMAEAERDRAIREEAARLEAQASADRLRVSEERLRLALLIAEMGTFEIDLRTDAVTVNDAGRSIYGWHANEPLTFAKVQAHFHPDDREEVMRKVDEAFRPEGPGEFEVEHRIVRSDGVTRWIRVRGRAIFEPIDVERRAMRCVGTYLDITPQKDAEGQREQILASERTARSEAERAGRMKDEFLATLSHELRTPLNAILGWSHILARGEGLREEVAEGLRTIERNARAQAQIIEDLLDMSRIISGKVRLDVQRVEIAALIRDAVETTKPSANAKGIDLSVVLDPMAGPVSGDPARLQQVMWNLLSNAVKFTPKGGRVQVLLERVNSHVEASVIDSGEGIKPEFLPFVFDRFRQADATTTRRHGGLGLGLSIVKQLVELHGGSITVKSDGEGKGSTFILSLPLTVIHSDRQPDADRRHPKAGGAVPPLVPDLCSQIAGVKVLVVDDEPDARALVKRLLEDCNAVVFTAASGGEALQILQAQRPDVLVSDIGMPTQDGYEFMKQVRALTEERGGKTPALALTAYARAEDRVKAVRAGFHMHVPKPVEAAELIAMVASLAQRGSQ